MDSSNVKEVVTEVAQPALSKTSHQEPKRTKEVQKKYLVNKLNYINFQDGNVHVTLKHIKYGRTVTLPAKPEPCLGEHLDCLWTETEGIQQKLRNYRFENLLVDDGKNLLLVESEEVSLSDRGVCLLLPERCLLDKSRKAKRYPTEGVRAQIVQNGAVFSGTLVEFSGASFRVEATVQPPQSFQWIRSDSPLSLILSSRDEVLYTGECRILKQAGGQKTRTFILESINTKIQKFKSKKYRCIRHELNPSPDIIFTHPLTNKLINLKVLDISGLGFSVEENADDPVLLPGLIIPVMDLSLSNGVRFKCRSQIVHRTVVEKETSEQSVRCGFAILDMAIQDHLNIISLTQQAKNKHLYVSNKVDLDSLWDFFFETGFIYPKKYKAISENKPLYKKTYEKLYLENPEIARHFIFQDRGKICGHFAMLRFFENTWINHHHAAVKSGLNRTGLMVVGQISNYINESYKLHSAHMNYMAGFFRPENKFPRRYFGGCAEKLKNPKKCSVDPFAYLKYKEEIKKDAIGLPESLELRRTTPNEISELVEFYEFESGGLTLQAIDLIPEMLHHCELTEEYTRIGLKREKNVFSVYLGGIFRAIVMATLSDVGLNMSELTNCIYIFAIDQNFVTEKNIQMVTKEICNTIDYKEFSIMLYPERFAIENSISFEKTYCMWVLSLEYADDYMEYMETLLGSVKA